MKNSDKSLQKERGTDRRSKAQNVIFPITLVDGGAIAEDRRVLHRRYSAHICEQQLFIETPYYLLESTLSECPVRQLEVGEILISKGQENHFLYLLSSGCLHIYFNLTDAKEAFVVKEGECVGEVSLFDGNPALTYTVAAEKSEVIVIHEDVFWQKIAILPRAAKNLLQLLAQRIIHSNEVLLKKLEGQLKLQQTQKELAVAAEIQMNMLPKCEDLFSGLSQIKAYAIMRPAAEVGGDFYDAFWLDDKHLIVAVGDVSGKGMPAALFMMRTVSLLRAKISNPQKFASALKQINQSLCEKNDASMFVTLFVGLLNVATGELCYTNGGHLPPLLARKADPTFAPLAAPSNIVLGINSEAQYEVAHTQLKAGDTLVLFTDGVTEAENSQREFFSTAKTIEVLTHMHSSDLDAVVNALSDEIAKFCGTQSQSDDMTVFALQYLG